MTTNFERAFGEHADVFAAWQQLNAAVKSHMDLRRYELATFAAAQRLKSSYCSLAHGSVLIDKFDEPVEQIARDRENAGLSEIDLAVMSVAEQVVDDATAVDTQPLRDLGLTDAEIMDVVLAASARCFFSKTLDGVGVLPDASYSELSPELLDVLVIGKPIAPA
ncbi:MAG TPA: hypothetical protein VGU02_10140 [Gaiellaceae bacterium]|nr:hypothetical protein [Gaiellaceae bacterium]